MFELSKFAPLGAYARADCVHGWQGLLVNLVGMYMFKGGHGHSHGGSENHRDHGHGHERANVDLDYAAAAEGAAAHSNGDRSMNIRGVFLHVAGDFLGSVAVVIVALVIWLSDWEHRHLLDPSLSLVIVGIIVFGTVPMVKESTLVLLQTAPAGFDPSPVRKELENIKGVVGTHELHIWNLAGNKTVASVHVTFRDTADYLEAAPKIKDFFHFRGIHSLTIQPEFLKSIERPNTDWTDDVAHKALLERECLLPCIDDSCANDKCCATQHSNYLTPGELRNRFTSGLAVTSLTNQSSRIFSDRTRESTL